MKSTSPKLIILSFILAVSSCSKDVLVERETDSQNPGLLSREYRFENEEYIGYIDYYYDELHFLSEKITTSSSNKINKTLYIYEDNKLSQETSYNSDNKLEEEKKYEYTAFDSISKINVFRQGNLAEVLQYEYNEHNLKSTERLFQDGNLIYANIYEYDDQNILWKVTNINQNGQTSGYSVITNFSNLLRRIDYYNQDQLFTGYSVYTFNDLGILRQKEKYNKFNELVERTEMSIEDGRVSEVITYNDQNKEVFRIIYQYNH